MNTFHKLPFKQTFGQWMRDTRETRGWTISFCADKSNMKWNVWQRLENDEPKRQNGLPPQPTRATVLKIAATLEASSPQALQAAGYTDSLAGEQADEQTASLMALFEGLDLPDQDDLLQLALIKWKRKYPDFAPPAQPIAVDLRESQPGEFLCLDLRSGQLAFAAGIQPVENILDRQQQLMDILIRLLTWQDDLTANAQEIAQDIRQAQQFLNRADEDTTTGVFEKTSS